MSRWGNQFHNFLFDVNFVQHYYFIDEKLLLIDTKCGLLQISFGLSFLMKWHVLLKSVKFIKPFLGECCITCQFSFRKIGRLKLFDGVFLSHTFSEVAVAF